MHFWYTEHEKKALYARNTLHGRTSFGEKSIGTSLFCYKAILRLILSVCFYRPFLGNFRVSAQTLSMRAFCIICSSREKKKRKANAQHRCYSNIAIRHMIQYSYVYLNSN